MDKTSLPSLVISSPWQKRSWSKGFRLLSNDIGQICCPTAGIGYVTSIKRAFAVCLILAVVVIVILIHRDAGVRQRAVMKYIPSDIKYEDLHNLMPNFHHQWTTRNVLVVSPKRADYRLCNFGVHITTHRDWQTVCKFDSDGDGATNGEEMGDPCCRWTPGNDNFKYRVWNLSHPGNFLSNLTKEQLLDITPKSCDLADEANETLKYQQFLHQYYMMHESDLQTADGLRWLKYPMAGLISLVIGHWSVKQGLLRDLFSIGPEGEGGAPLSRQKRLLVALTAYLWTDGVAGLTHLTFDFCPRDYPIIGSVATGFQFHHFHPSAWVVVPFWQMMSHSLPLLGVISSFLLILRPTRPFRLFWTWTFILCCTTVVSHRWCHIPPEELPVWYRMLQWSGLLMTHEHHQAHHLSLVTQFSNLSGVTDFILDWLTNWIPAWQYQNWLSVTIVYLALPIVLGSDTVQSFLTLVEHRILRKPSIEVGIMVDEIEVGKLG